MNRNDMTSKKRITRVLLTVLVIALLLVLRVFYLQVVMAGWLKQSAEEQRFRAVKVLPRRGTICDRLGESLALSNDGECVYIVPQEVGIEGEELSPKGRKITKLFKGNKEKDKVAQLVSGVLSLDPLQVRKKFDQKASFVWLKRKTTYEEVDKLKRVLHDNRIDGILITVSPQRFYPQGSLAAQLLGVTGIDNQGLEGLEKYLDVYLQGIPGSDQAEYDTMGRHIPQGERKFLEPVPGDTVYLTIDHNIQYIVERELAIAVEENQCKRGMVILVNPQTGEILSVANYPKYDPNHFNDFPSANRRNPVFCDMYEPGSTFKIVTATAALEEGKVTPESTFFDPGYLLVGNHPVRCWKDGGHGQENFLQAMENSCNPVFATLGLRLGKDTLYKYIRSFGFGKTTQVDFPGESPGSLQPLSRVHDMELANIGFGQGINVTPIQMVMAASAVANGGYLLKPQLIKEIRSADGKLKRTAKRQVIRQVMSTKTSALLSQMLESVVANGSGNRAYLEGYRVAGKTGTAQKALPGQRGYRQYICSFLGFAPANNPQILGIVILDEPGNANRFGGVIAAPVFGNICRDALRYLNVRPQYVPEKTDKPAVTELIMPNVMRLTSAEAAAALKQQQFAVRVIGHGNIVLDQIPKPGSRVLSGTQVILYLEPPNQIHRSQNKIVLPNFLGLSDERVREELTKMGLKLDASGSGKAVSQMPIPGTPVEYGATVRIIFKNE